MWIVYIVQSWTYTIWVNSEIYTPTLKYINFVEKAEDKNRYDLLKILISITGLKLKVKINHTTEICKNASVKYTELKYLTGTVIKMAASGQSGKGGS